MVNKPMPCHSRFQANGVVAVLSMMFLVIFASLATAMAIVSQGNLRTAETHRKVNRSLAAAETGMKFVIHRLGQITPTITIREGVIDETLAADLWEQTSTALLASIQNEFHNIKEPALVGNVLEIGPIAVGPGAPTFEATLSPHPMAGEDYDSAFYQQPPYNTINPPVSAANPLNARWVRVRVTAGDGATEQRIFRSISMDFLIDKKIRFAILAKSRIMVGRNVMIEGRIGSRFEETWIDNGHPVQIESDFRGLDTSTGGLDDQLDALVGTLIANDQDSDNRIHIANTTESEGMTDPDQYDTNLDGYIDDYDFFLAHYDANSDGRVSAFELDTGSDINKAQLIELIDTFGNPTRNGYGDGFIDNDDRYAKIRGEVLLTAELQGWLDGAASGAYQDLFQGSIHPSFDKDPLTFEADEVESHKFESSDFDVTSFDTMATGDFWAQATTQAAMHNPSDPDSPQPLGHFVIEEVPYESPYPYDYYNREIIENMTFANVKIPKGTNTLFRNCRFIGVTFVETTVDNSDPDYNYAGMQEADLSQKYPGRTAMVEGVEITDTKTEGNNIRFDNCTFEGGVVTSSPDEFTHVRNKMAFTGTTRFDLDSGSLSQEEQNLFRRSTLLSPHYSVEMGTFVDPAAAGKTVELSGTIVAGVLDMRGQVKVNGTILTTFEPASNKGPVIGETSPQFNTTLGYFSSTAGDLEAEIPASGVGVIQIRYDPTLSLPDGILGPIEIQPMVATYFESGAY